MDEVCVQGYGSMRAVAFQDMYFLMHLSYWIPRLFNFHFVLPHFEGKIKSACKFKTDYTYIVSLLLVV